jgi:predicted membrane metal-binding protein
MGARGMSLHEPISSYRDLKPGSERAFGLVFGAVFSLIGLLPAVIHRAEPRWWALAVAIVFLAVAFLAPAILRPLNKAWFRLGLLLNHVVSPVVMGVLYVVAFIPMGVFMRAAGKDLLRLKRDPAAESYWITRDPAGPAPGSMHRQF